MELLSLAILVVLIGALLSIGWQLGPIVLIGALIYAVVRYHRQILKSIRDFLGGLRHGRKK